EKVVPHWVSFFNENSRVYCGFVDGKIASFCLIEDFGEHVVNGQNWKIGGPGCVGTILEYRDRGIGLTMVRNVTKILQDEFYDYSYIHYTYETKWYGKLGYETFLSWCGKGFV
ncbi:MAG: GNAT family N-acetyltransferase, partial [Lachnospiraceae bacterium]|nr:GNAT family N-acetyltransferase [Lachnospiraceae bacterium]